MVTEGATAPDPVVAQASAVRMKASAEAGGNDGRQLASWRTLVRSFAELSIGEAIARVMGFVALVALTRRLGPASFGVVTLGVTLVLWIKVIVDSGTETLNIREISRQPDRFREIAGAVLALRLCLSAAAIAIFVPVAFLVADHSRRTVALFALVLPVVALNPRFMVLGLRAAKGVAIGNIAGQVLFAAGVLVLVRGPHESFVVPLLMAAAELTFGVVVVVFVARRFGLPVPRIDLPAWRSALRGGLPLMVTQLAGGAVQSFGLILIAAVLGSYSTGVYGAAYKPLLFFATLTALLGGSFLASYSAAGPAQARRLLHRTSWLALLASLTLALVLSIGSGFFLSAAFGSDYRSGATALSILAWLLPLTALGITYGTVLIATGRQTLLMRNNIVASVFNVGATAVAVPLAGISGAAVVAVLSSAVVVFLNHRSCTRSGLAPSAGEMLSGALTLIRLRPDP